MLLPLIGGYVAIHRFYYTRYRAARLQGHRLIFEGALVGVLLVVMARLATRVLLWTKSGQFVNRMWVDMVGEVPWSATCFGALILGVILPVALNVTASLFLQKDSADSEPPTKESEPAAQGKGSRPGQELENSVELPAAAKPESPVAKVIRLALSLRLAAERILQPSRDHALDRAIESFGEPLHGLFRWAVKRDKPVMISLRDRKVYVGMIAEVNESGPDQQFLALLPVFSAYRDSETLKVCFSTPYPAPSDVSGELDFQADDLMIVVPLSQVQSAHLFDKEVWDRGYFGEAEGANS